MNEKKLENIIREILKEMNASKTGRMEAQETEEYIPDVSTGELVEIYDVKNPENGEAFYRLKQASPSRIGIGNAGSRYLTKSSLRFEADAATAVDAVWHELPHEFVEKLGIFEVKTFCKDKADFIQFPEKGRKISEEGVSLIKEKCVKNPQVQIILSDGHAASAVEANTKAILPTIIEGLKAEGISVGTPFFVRFGRVAAEDHIAELVNAEIIIDLIGERPALASNDSMSAYIAYRPTVGMSESRRTVVSNISRLGTPPVEAGAHIVDLIKLMLEKKTSGTELAQMM